MNTNPSLHFKRMIIGSDHAAVKEKEELKTLLSSLGMVDIIDVGTHDASRVDYPDVAHKLCGQLTQEWSAKGPIAGILLCGSGIGMSIAANKYRVDPKLGASIRAALCHNEYTARMCRQHNDCNVLCLGTRVLGMEVIKCIVETFVTTAFEGGRHAERLAKLQ